MAGVLIASKEEHFSLKRVGKENMKSTVQAPIVCPMDS